MEGHVLHTRLAALAAGALVACAAIAALSLALPPQSAVEEGVNYGYVYSGAKSASTAFTTASMDSNSMLVFGSSELSTPASDVPEVPSEVFGKNDYGLQLVYVGEAYDQSLWHAIAAGAYADTGLANNKVVIIVSPGWFEDGGLDASTFKTRFSYSLYEQFCSNASISDETKAYVQKRLLEQGIDEMTVDAGAKKLPQDAIDSAALLAKDDLLLRSQLISVRDKGIAAVDDGGAANAPDFEALLQQASNDTEARSSSNSWGVIDSFWHERLEGTLDQSEGLRASETYTETPEYDDFACLLEVCKETGLQPLVVISPVMGPYYDHIGISKDTRAACYEHIRQIAKSYNATIADYSENEYERGFLYDIVHFGWIGWVDVEQSIYDYADVG